MEKQQWERFHEEMLGLYDLYKEAQLALAAAEEFAETKYIASVVNELRAVLHHLMEAFKEFQENPTWFGWQKQFIKAKEEHLLRAIFDAYHLSISLQQQEIRDVVERYDTSVITEVFPTYYKELRPYIVSQNLKLADARTKRNEGSLDIFKEVLIKTQDHKILCDVMVEVLEKRKQEKEEALAKEVREKEEALAKDKNNSRRPWVIAVITMVIGGILGAFFKEEMAKIYDSPQKNQSPRKDLLNQNQIDSLKSDSLRKDNGE